MTRTDTHSPTNFDPAEYIEVGYCDNHHEDGGMWLDNEAAAGRSGSVDYYEDGNYASRGRCDHCGAGPLRYAVLFLHKPSDQVVAVGEACAVKLALETRGQVELRRNLEAAKREAKRLEFVNTLTADQQAAIDLANEAINYPYTTDEGRATDFKVKFPAYRGHSQAFASDLLHKLNRYGSLTEKQVGALVSMKQRNDEWTAKRQDEQDALAKVEPLAEGRYEITGTIVSTKYVENDFGGQWKMLVKLEDGNKVYGSIPSALLGIMVAEHTYVNVEKGDTVTFTATVERSKDDDHFGFYKRPSKASAVFAAPVQS
jgi:hypothetical protein